MKLLLIIVMFVEWVLMRGVLVVLVRLVECI